MVQIVAVDRADIVEAELLEQRAAGPEAACMLGAPLVDRRSAAAEIGQFLADLAQATVGLARDSRAR
jgi:hypothetical protein